MSLTFTEAGIEGKTVSTSGFDKQIVILNGPPGCGKDTLADGTHKYFGQRQMFKNALYDLTFTHFGLDSTLLEFEYFKDMLCNDRVLKELPNKLFEYEGKWLSPREALIHTSEVIAKPLFGDDVFGKYLSDKLTASRVIITDGGFDAEIESLRKLGYFIKIVQLHGRGNFDGDSRGYISKEGYDITTYRVLLEDDNIKEGVNSIIDIVKRPLVGDVLYG
jgi:hypothetical protein